MTENYVEEEIAQLREELFLLSRLSNPYLECPMARVDGLDKYQPGDDVPVSYDGGDKGTIKLPKEFYQLRNHGFWVRIKVPLLSETIMATAFEVRISGSGIHIPEVKFTWGKVTGMASLSFQGFIKTYPSSIPEGFSIDSLIELLTKGSIKQFVINHALLTESGREEVMKLSLFL